MPVQHIFSRHPSLHPQGRGRWKTDSSVSGDPLTYLHGHGNLVAGLEREFKGKNVGDELHVKVAAADGYGEYDKGPRPEDSAPRAQGDRKFKVGMRPHAQTEHGPARSLSRKSSAIW